MNSLTVTATSADSREFEMGCGGEVLFGKALAALRVLDEPLDKFEPFHSASLDEFVGPSTLLGALSLPLRGELG